MIIAISGGLQCGKDTIHTMWKEYPPYTTWEHKAFAAKLKALLALMFNVPVEKFASNEFKDQLLPEEWQVYHMYNYGRLLGTVDTLEEAENLVARNNSQTQYTYIKSQRTFRWALQYIGTDLLRSSFHKNTHVNMLFNEYVGWKQTAHTLTDWTELYHHPHCAECGNPYAGYKRQRRCKDCIERNPIVYPNWFITDLRFPNEYARLKKENAFLIKVIRRFDLRYPDYSYLIKEDPYAIPQELSTVDPELYTKLTHNSEISLPETKYTFDAVVVNNGTLAELEAKVFELKKEYERVQDKNKHTAGN